MKMQWQRIWLKATFWLLTEILLNLLGLDNLADYSEFLFEQEVAIALRQPQMAVVVPSYYHPFSDLPHYFIAAQSA
jgi:hypothetical protein